MKTTSIYIIMLYVILVARDIQAQNIDSLLNENAGNNPITGTFFSTRIINGHSTERMPEGQLDFRISHRFGELNQGAYDFFGLDEANIHFSLEYGITNWVMAGVGRGSYQKTYDGFLKFSLLRQTAGNNRIPVSLSWLSTMAVNTLKRNDSEKPGFWNRSVYVHQLLISRKFSDRLSLEVNPTFLHRNMVVADSDPNDVWAIGLGGRFKITKRLALIAEYYAIIPPGKDMAYNEIYNPLSLGIDIETGGHVFTITFTNSLAMTEEGFIGNTLGDWSEGDVHPGFNISRVFMLK